MAGDLLERHHNIPELMIAEFALPPDMISDNECKYFCFGISLLLDLSGFFRMGEECSLLDGLKQEKLWLGVLGPTWNKV